MVSASGRGGRGWIGIKWIQGFRCTGAGYRYTCTLAAVTRSWVLTAASGYATQPSRGRKTQIDLEKKKKIDLAYLGCGRGRAPSGRPVVSGWTATVRRRHGRVEPWSRWLGQGRRKGAAGGSRKMEKGALIGNSAAVVLVRAGRCVRPPGSPCSWRRNVSA